MTTVDLEIGDGSVPSPAAVDQSHYAGDIRLNAIARQPDTTLTITNDMRIDDVLDLQYTMDTGQASRAMVSLGPNTSVKLVGVTDAEPGSQFDYHLGNGATLAMTPGFLSQGPDHTLNINLDDAGASTLVYDSTGIAPGQLGTINLTGITTADQIQVVGATSGAYVDGQLIFKNAHDITIGQFDAPGLDAGKFVFSGGNTSYACYLKGTRIATPSGDILVEDLRAGDTVATARGGVATVKWIGYRTLRRARIPSKDAIRAFPITFTKNAIARDVPHRDVAVSPHHLVLVNGSLIPAMLLVNGKTITQDFSRQTFQYFHVELERFDILLADGLPAESYVDMGNRSMFENAATVDLHPDFAAPTDGSRPKLDGITVQRSGAAVEAVRGQLLKRAAYMTRSVRVSDPDLRLAIDGQEIRSQSPDQIEGVLRFVLPHGAPASDLHILSRSAIVRDTSAHARRDLRQIGVGLARIVLEDAAGRRDIDLMNPSLSGLHPAQDVRGVLMRWTDGAAVVPAALLKWSGPTVIELHVLRTYSYWRDAQKRAA